MAKYRRPIEAPMSYGLEEEVHVPAVGPSGDAHLAIVGEAPGAEEVRKLEPFVGDAGQDLNWALAQATIYRPGVYMTNVIDVRPPGNDIKSELAMEAIRAQRDLFWREMRDIVFNKGVRVIMALGNTAVHAFGISGAISRLRGSVFEINLDWPGPVTDPEVEPCHVVVIPSWHPSYFTRQRRFGSNRGKGKIDEMAVWVHDFKKAKDIAVNGYVRPRENFTLEPTLEDFLDFADAVIEKRQTLACDIETTGFNGAMNDVYVIGFATDAETGFSVPMLAEGGKSYWRPDQLPVVNQKLNEIFANCPLIFQNAPFDVNFLRDNGYDITMECVADDTLLVHHAVDPEQPHRLDYITSIYGVTPYWKDALAGREGTLATMPQLTLRRYNLRDCIVLWQVLPPMLEDLKKMESSYRVYREESLPLLEATSQMKRNGIYLNKEAQATVKKELAATVKRLDAELRQIADLPPEFSLSSDTDLRLFLYGHKAKKYNKADELEKKKPGTKVYEECRQMAAIVNNTHSIYHPPGFRPRTTKEAKVPQVDEQARLGLRVAAQNRLEELASFRRPTEKHAMERQTIERLLLWLEKYGEYAQATKLLSTYTDYKTGIDGRVHPTFLVHGTATGRFSSKNPNFQNLPKGNPIIRRMFTVEDESWWIVSADYSNLEVAVLAYVSGDQRLIDIIEEGRNLHDENNRILFPDLTPDHPLWKAGRDAAKVFQFGGISYGGGPREIYEKVLLKAPKLRLTFADFKRALDRWMEEHPGYREWAEKQKHDVLDPKGPMYRKVMTFAGRMRRCYGSNRDIEKIALNTPIQGGAAHIINAATIRIERRLRGMRSRLQAQIHDEIRVEAHPRELDDVVALLREEMEKPVEINGVERRFRVDVEKGKNWADLEKGERGEE